LPAFLADRGFALLVAVLPVIVVRVVLFASALFAMPIPFREYSE